MTGFTVNSSRIDPYKNFKFLVKFGPDGRVVAGVNSVSALTQTTETVTHRDGGDMSTSHIMPTTTSFGAITLQRGITHDPEFENWAKKVWDYSDNKTPLNSFRKEIRIELLNEQGKVAKAYNVFRCWVSEYTALPELDSNSAAVAIESIVLQNEGWERDIDVTEPAEA